MCYTIFMPVDRIKTILAEIASIARNPRVITLAVELGEEIEKRFGKTDAKVARVIDTTTYAVTDVSETLHDDMRMLRQAIDRLADDFSDHKDVVSGRIHTLANHMGSVEAKVHELAEAIDQLYENGQASSTVIEQIANAGGLSLTLRNPLDNERSK
jgi:methyl-accepting chemotaxis protein